MGRRKRSGNRQQNTIAAASPTGISGGVRDDRLEKARKRYGIDQALAPIHAARGASGEDAMMNLSQFESANGSDRRGWVYMPNLDTRRDLDSYSRIEMVKKSRWLQDNVGFAGRCVEGLADMIGYFMPAAGTKDTRWNDAAELYFLNRVMEPAVFDRAGKLDFAEWQLSISRDCLGDGDNLTVLTETRNPSPKEPGRAMIAYYESHQIASKQKPRHHRNDAQRGATEEIDGVVLDRKTGRRIGYKLTDDPGDRARDGITIAARDVIFCANQKRHNRVRGITALHRAVNHMIDATEIAASTKGAIKAAADIVYQLINQDSKSAFPFHPVQGLHREIEVEPDGTVKTDGEGSASAQKVRLEDLMGMPVALQLDNRKLEMVHDTRPHPNQIEFINKYLNRDISWGVGVSSEILWMFDGESSPAIRFRMDEFRRWITMRQRTLRRAVQRFWVYFWAKEFALGYPMPKDPNWWACDWVPLADLTIDHGRDGKLELARLEVGADTITDIYRRRGMGADTALQRRAKDILSAEEIAQDMLGDRARWREILPGSERNAAVMQAAEMKDGGGNLPA